MINYCKKDITTVTFGIIAHGVNAQHAMGSGVALAIKTKWPKIYTTYMNSPKGREMLGTAHIVDVSEDNTPLFVANCYTQEFYGPGDRKYADQKAIISCLDSVLTFARYHDNIPLWMPKIGAGLGGLDWETEVCPIVEYIAI